MKINQNLITRPTQPNLTGFRRFTGFKRDHGFRVPSSSVMADDGPLQSPYNIPVLGQEKTVRYGGGYRSTYGGAVKEDYFGGGDSDGRGRGVAGLLSDNFGNVGNFGAAAADDDNDGFEFGPSPFKYHYDVSLNAADGDEGDGFDDQVRNQRSNLKRKEKIRIDSAGPD